MLKYKDVRERVIQAKGTPKPVVARGFIDNGYQRAFNLNLSLKVKQLMFNIK